MNCLNCTPISKLISPSVGFTFGDSFTFGGDYRIYIENTAINQLHFEDVEADADGAVTLDMEFPDEHFYHPNATYKIWVTELGGLLYDTVDITKGAISYVCLQVQFDNIIGTTNVFTNQPTQTL
jgi:hypothetical protein